MKTKVVLVTLAVVAVLAGGLLIARAAERPLAMRGKVLERIASKLHLTKDQRTQIKAVLVADKEPILSLLTRWHEAHKQLRAAIQAGNATVDSVRAAAANVAAVEADLAVERLKLHGKIYPLLTADQKLQVTVMEDHVDAFLDGVIARIGAGLNQ